MAADRRFRLSPAADRDLAQIWRYTARRWSIEQADRYQDDLASAFEGLASGAKQGRPVEVKRSGYLKYAVGAHVIYFREGEREIVVLRILHGKQDIDRHPMH